MWWWVTLLLGVGCAELPERDPVGLPSGTSPTVGTTPLSPPTASTSGEPEPMGGFSFVDEHVAGMPQPYPEDLPFLADQIDLLVTLTGAPMDPDALAAEGIEALHLPIETSTPPTLEQQDVFVAEVELRVAAGERVGAHCMAGVGRTGTMLATWFVAKGYEPDEAIDVIRELRPGSIEPGEQEASVFEYAAARAR